MTERGTLTGADLARLRQGCYRLLAAGFGRPSADATDRIGTGIVALEDMGAGIFPYMSAFRAWVTALAVTPIGDVEAEHVRLFGSGMDGAICPPVESQQLGVNLQGDPARHAGRIEGLMRRAGFEPLGDDRPPDHIVVELELASALCGVEAAARGEGDSGVAYLEWQQELIAVLAMWIPDFANRVVERDRSGVFGPLVRSAEAFIEHELDLVRLMISAAGAFE